MAASEKSIFWAAPTHGHGTAAYTQEELFAWLNRTFLSDPAVQGVLPNYANTLAVTGTSSPVSVASGAAVVNGIPYENTAPVTIAIPTPTTGLTAHRIVLQVNYTTQTVLIARISSPDGTITFPALTQNSSIWEVPLANISIAPVTGTITVQDARGYAHFNTRVSGNMLDTSVVDGTSIEIVSNTLQIADDGVDDTKIGSRVVTLPARVGGDPLGWSDAGSNGYVPTGVMMQVGSVAVPFVAEADSYEHINFPDAYSTDPLVVGTAQTIPYVCVISGVTTTGFDLYIYNSNNAPYTGNITANWIAIGPS